MSTNPSLLPRLSLPAVLLVTAWLAAGALFKLLAGSPADLPPTVREMSPLGLDATFKTAISVELAVASLALFAARLAWPLLVGVLLVFLGVLAPLVAAGAESCGCFGSSVPIPPAAMMGIDGALLLLLLATRPWSSLAGRRVHLVPGVLLAVLGILAPWLYIESDQGSAPAPQAVSAMRGAGGGATTEATGTSASPRSSTGGAGAGAPSSGERDVAGPGGTSGESAAPAASGAATGEEVHFAGAWTPPETWPRYVILEPSEWEGLPARETVLHRYLDTDALPPGATWILWRESCDHCAEHLRELALEDDPSRLLVLVRLPDDADMPKVVDVKPPALLEIDLPRQVKDWVIETPWELVVDEDGVIVEAIHPDGDDH